MEHLSSDGCSNLVTSFCVLCLACLNPSHEICMLLTCELFSSLEFVVWFPSRIYYCCWSQGGQADFLPSCVHNKSHFLGSQVGQCLCNQFLYLAPPCQMGVQSILVYQIREQFGSRAGSGGSCNWNLYLLKKIFLQPNLFNIYQPQSPPLSFTPLSLPPLPLPPLFHSNSSRNKDLPYRMARVITYMKLWKLFQTMNYVRWIRDWLLHSMKLCTHFDVMRAPSICPAPCTSSHLDISMARSCKN